MFKRLKAWWNSFMDTMPTPAALDLVSQGARETAEKVEELAKKVEAQKKPAQKRSAAIKNPPKKPTAGTRTGASGAKKPKPKAKRG